MNQFPVCSIDPLKHIASLRPSPCRRGNVAVPLTLMFSYRDREFTHSPRVRLRVCDSETPSVV
jgi:hypothetical protein